MSVDRVPGVKVIFEFFGSDECCRAAPTQLKLLLGPAGVWVQAVITTCRGRFGAQDNGNFLHRANVVREEGIWVGTLRSWQGVVAPERGC